MADVLLNVRVNAIGERQLTRVEGNLRDIGRVGAASMAQINAASTTTTASLTRMGSVAAGAGGGLRSLGGALGGVNVAALGGVLAVGQLTSEAIGLEQATVKLQTQLGLAASEAQAVEDQAQRLATTYGVSARASVDAGFAIQSAGLRGAAAQEALEAASKGAAIGLGEAREIGLLSSAAMTAYGEANLSATRSTELLAAAVKAGNLDASELASSLGQALAPAATLNVGFDELAGSVAFYTRLGVGASEATTAVRSTMAALISPSQQAARELEAVGLSADQVRGVVAEQGLAAALQLISERLGGNQEAFARIIPSVEALGFALAATSEGGAADLEQIMRDMRNSSGALDEAWKIQANTAGTQLAVSWQKLEGIGVDLAGAVIPKLAGGLGEVLDAFRSIDAVKADEAIDRVTEAMARFNKEFAEGSFGGGRGIAGLNEVWGDLNRNLEGTSGLLGTLIGVGEFFVGHLGANLGTTFGEAEANSAAWNASIEAGISIARRAGIEVDGTAQSWATAKEELRGLGFTTGDFADQILKRLIDGWREEQEAERQAREERARGNLSRGYQKTAVEALSGASIEAAAAVGSLDEAEADALLTTGDLAGAVANLKQVLDEMPTTKSIALNMTVSTYGDVSAFAALYDTAYGGDLEQRLKDVGVIPGGVATALLAPPTLTDQTDTGGGLTADPDVLALLPQVAASWPDLSQADQLAIAQSVASRQDNLSLYFDEIPTAAELIKKLGARFAQTTTSTTPGTELIDDGPVPTRFERARGFRDRIAAAGSAFAHREQLEIHAPDLVAEFDRLYALAADDGEVTIAELNYIGSIGDDQLREIEWGNQEAQRRDLEARKLEARREQELEGKLTRAFKTALSEDRKEAELEAGAARGDYLGIIGALHAAGQDATGFVNSAAGRDLWAEFTRATDIAEELRRQEEHAANLAREGFVRRADGSWGVPTAIPEMARGGIVRTPTLALIGEAGPEAVVPLGAGGRAAVGGAVNISVTIQGNVASQADFAETVVSAVQNGVQQGLSLSGQRGAVAAGTYTPRNLVPGRASLARPLS